METKDTLRDSPLTPDHTPPRAGHPHAPAAEIFPPRRPAGRRLRVAAVVLACILIGGVSWWYAGLRNYFFPDNFGVVEPGKIYRSAQIHPRVLRQTLLDNNIRVIVDLSQEESGDAQAEKQIAAELGIERISVPGLGGKGVGEPGAYPAALRAVVKANRQGKAVLVHCQSGAQRTGGVIATYRMLVQGWSENDAFAEAKQFHYRPTQNPHLVPFVEQHLGEWKATLEAEHVVPLHPTTPTR